MTERTWEYRVLITFNSGHTIDDWFVEFEYISRKFTWTLSNDSVLEQIMFIDVDAIESVVVVSKRPSKTQV